MKCVFCGCTEDHACLVELNEQPQAIRDRIRRAHKRLSQRPPKFVGCSWISTEPPVCSAPACAAKQAVA